MEGKKDIFGLYTFFGKENRADWNKVFEDLINRGLKRVLVVVSDDFPGIIETVKAVYPYADHQLCFVHLQRNIRKYMTKADAAEFNKELDKIKFASSFDEAVQSFMTFAVNLRVNIADISVLAFVSLVLFESAQRSKKEAIE